MRIGLARLMYHGLSPINLQEAASPESQQWKLALLDESTSALDEENERNFFSTLQTTK
jgi:hypothetical protein